jgi:2-polyprenyl-6-methoxyphenol hydroxylase-like FAD-dependent oxidoreductase
VRVGIVGGGIAGLSAAIALGGDHDVMLFERSASLTTTGAGIIVSANAGRALRTLGVPIDDVGRRVGESTIARADGRPIQVIDLGADVNRLGPTVATSRSELHEALASSVPSSVKVRLGESVGVVEASTATVVGAEGPTSFDVLVGADGINSHVRASLADPGRVVPAHVACWRALVAVEFDGGPVEYLGSGQRVGAVGLASGTCLYLVESAAPGELAELDVDHVRARFASFTAVRALLDGIETLRFDDLAELHRPIWGVEPTVLIGDAAHAMTPNLGQGASMAIEDAVLLGRTAGPGAGWLQGFVQQRGPRVSWVQSTSRRFGSLLHARSAPMRWLRDTSLRHTPQSVTRRQTERLLGGGPVPAITPAVSGGVDR